MPNINYCTSRFASSKEDALDFVKTYESWHKPPIFIIFSFLRSIQTSESFFTFNTRNLQKLPDFTIFYWGKGASRLGSLVIWCAPKYHKGLEDASPLSRRQGKLPKLPAKLPNA
jgi:hypothetical protein